MKSSYSWLIFIFQC